MSDDRKALRTIKSIQDKEGVVKALVVTTHRDSPLKDTVRVLYPRHTRFEQMLKAKEAQDS